MSYKDLCEAVPSTTSVEYVRFISEKDGRSACCTWDESARVAKDVEGKLSQSIRVVAEYWWVEHQYFSCQDPYFSGWEVRWIPEEDVVYISPELKDLER